MLRKTGWLGFCLTVCWTLVGPLRADDREWTVAKHLQVAGQPASLKQIKDVSESYRFVLTDAGVTSSTIVWLYLKNNQPQLKAADVSLHEYYDSKGKEGVELVERKLTREEWAAFKQKFTGANYWNVETPNRLVLDGGCWSLEASAFGRHRIVNMVAADEGDYRAACLEMWRLSGVFMGYYENKQR